MSGIDDDMSLTLLKNIFGANFRESGAVGQNQSISCLFHGETSNWGRVARCRWRERSRLHADQTHGFHGTNSMKAAGALVSSCDGEQARNRAKIGLELLDLDSRLSSDEGKQQSILASTRTQTTCAQSTKHESAGLQNGERELTPKIKKNRFKPV